MFVASGKLFLVVIECTVYLVCNTASFEKFSEVIQDLSACYKVNIVSKVENSLGQNCVKDNVGVFVLYLVVPDELKKAIELDMPKMEQKKEKLLKELEKMTKMVSGETYSTKVAVEAQEFHLKKIATLEEKLSRINYIQSLSRQQ